MVLNVDVKIFDDEWKENRNTWLQEALDGIDKTMKKQELYVAMIIVYAIVVVLVQWFGFAVKVNSGFIVFYSLIMFGILGSMCFEAYKKTERRVLRKKHFTYLVCGIEELKTSNNVESAAQIVSEMQKEISGWKRSSLWDDFFIRRLFKMVIKLYDAKRVFSETVIRYECSKSDLKVTYQDKTGEVREHKFYCWFQTNKTIDEPRLQCEKGMLILEQNPSYIWKTDMGIKKNMELNQRECQNQDTAYLYWQ